MIELFRRIGFQRHYASPRRRKRLYTLNSEPLEARVLLAADMPIEAYSILNALSRGGDEMLSKAGLVAPLESNVVSSQSAVSSVDTSPVISLPSRPAPLPVVAASAVDTLNATSTNSGISSDAEGAEGEAGDVEIEVGDDVFVIYNANTGVLRLDTTTPVTTIEIVSESGIFTADDADNLGSVFDVDDDFKIF